MKVNEPPSRRTKGSKDFLELELRKGEGLLLLAGPELVIVIEFDYAFVEVGSASARIP